VRNRPNGAGKSAVCGAWALALLFGGGLAGCDDREPVPCPPGQVRVLVKVSTTKGVKRLALPASAIRQVDRAYSWSTPIEIGGDGVVRVVVRTGHKTAGRKPVDLMMYLFSDDKVRTKAAFRPPFVSPLNFWDAYREADAVREVVRNRPGHVFSLRRLVSQRLKYEMIARCPVCRVIIPTFYYVRARWTAIRGALLSCYGIIGCYFNAYVSDAVGVAVYAVGRRYATFPKDEALDFAWQADRFLAEARACARR
jgi:hypothetical protein